jgi:DNA-directed RNA polymerase subunit RPC12/RpoP
MASVVDEVYCRNCSELLFHVVRHDNGTTVMKESAPEPESNGIQKYYRCPTCQGKNLVMLIEEPRGCRYYEVAGFIRS